MCTNWLSDLHNLPKINRAWLYKDLESLSLTSNAVLTQSERHQRRIQEVPGSIPTVTFLLNICCSSLRKPLLPTLPALYNYGKTQLTRKVYYFGKWVYVSMSWICIRWRNFRSLAMFTEWNLGDSCMNNFFGKVNSYIADLEQCANHQSHWASTEYTVKQIEIPK